MQLPSPTPIKTNRGKHESHLNSALNPLAAMPHAVDAFNDSASPGRRRRGELWSTFDEVCALLNIAPPSSLQTNDMLFQHLRFHAGDKIHRVGDPLKNLYLVNCGFLKTSVTDENDKELILSFPMKGDLIGIDAIYQEEHAADVIALSECDVILLPYSTMLTIGQKYPELERALFVLMSREVVRGRNVVSMHRVLSAEAKVARFLANMGERFGQLGYSSRMFNLRMPRQDLASYLGVAVETVSRAMAAFHRLGVIKVNQRAVEILDLSFLNNLIKLPPTRLPSSKKTLTLAIPGLPQLTRQDLTLSLLSSNESDSPKRRRTRKQHLVKVERNGIVASVDF